VAAKRLRVSWILLLVLAAATGPRPPLPRAETLVILHTNDIHSHVFPFDTPGKKDIGGIARISTLIHTYKKQNQLTMALDAGDFFQGTAVFNLFHGKVETSSMDLAGYDCVCLGNHDLDEGAKTLMEALAGVGFPVISANVVVRSGGRGAPEQSAASRLLLPAYTIIRKGRFKIGVFGLTTSNLPFAVTACDSNAISTLDPFETCEEMLAYLKPKTDLQICLSHLGLKRDRRLAKRFADRGLDLVVGGHSHSLIDPPELIGGRRKIPVVQAACWGKYLGRVEFELGNGEAQFLGGGLIPIDDRIQEDPEVLRLLSPYADSMKMMMQEVIARAESTFFVKGINRRENALADLICDAVREETGADVAFVNAGGIRAPLLAGPISMASLYEVFPFDDYLVELELSGADLKRVFSTIARRLGKGNFVQFSGAELEICDRRIRRLLVSGKPIEKDRVYKVGTIDYIVNGGLHIPQLETHSPSAVSQTMVRDSIRRYLEKRGTVGPRLDGRLKVDKRCP